MVSKFSSKMFIPIYTHLSRNRSVVISLLLFGSFFRPDFCFYICSPKFKYFMKNLINGKCLKIIKAIINISRNTLICMVSHDIGYIFKYLKVINFKDLSSELKVFSSFDRSLKISLLNLILYNLGIVAD